MVLVVIGVVMSAVMVGNDVLRQAKGQKAFSVFVAGWREAFSQYTRTVGGLPNDTTPPVNMIGGDKDIFLCGTALSNMMLSKNVRIPMGNGTAKEDEYLYRDSTGSPQTLEICFATVEWSVQHDEVTKFLTVNRHVMRIQGLTAELALQMDVLVDGSVSARFGQFRMAGPHRRTTSADADWGALRTDTDNPDSAQNLVTAYFEMF